MPIEVAPKWVIIGFDRRLLPFMTAFRFAPTPTLRQVDCGPPYPATISPEIWRRPKNIEEIPRHQFNEVNLLYLPEASAEPSVEVAFLVDSAVLDGWSQRPHLPCIAEEFLIPDRGWKILGYDIVDSGLQLSALYGLHVLQQSDCDAIGVGKDLLNRFGLVSSLEIARCMKERFNEFGPVVHSNYQIVKVYVKLPSLLS